ncbi:CRISPR-associated helicase Cas3' [Lentibacillus daqui]|uniref:CRISPR-associated helicase Cas3' n=1 Tax=Lentibacillus daqui TaxID=2911514 RepID=UPI0022B18975|nr:CRISPR-associated helicase Cas3' [Lentibacillus daqui]
MDYIAHIRQSDAKMQTVKEHLIEVKALAEQYGEPIGIKHLAGLAGMLHDLGKYTNKFREYILEAVNNPDDPPKRGSVDHSTAGGKLLYERFHTEKIARLKGMVAEVVGNAIISHHSFLHDFITPDLESKYLKRVRDKDERDLPEFKHSVQCFFHSIINETDFDDYVEKACWELNSFIANEPYEDSEKQLMFLTKFVYSALIDADRTNTRLFEENKENEQTDYQSLFRQYYDRLQNKLQSLQNQPSANTPINQLRSEMSKQCEKFASRPSGIFTLSIPTGGGKTLASLRYALKHALLYNKKRIIYVVPYTTIIEQNAEEVRNILQDSQNILEHHSNIVEDMDDNDELQDGIMTRQQKLKLAKDNWESPIIFTTMVQFLNVFYAKGSRNIRRLHNLSESIIVFDEVQKVPVKCVSLFNQALNFLKSYCQSSMLLCTATQPALDFVEHKLEIDTDAEMIENLDDVVDAFKRVEIIDEATDRAMNNEELAEFVDQKLNDVQSVLVVLNTKTVARNLYQELKEKIGLVHIYHLSTSMCASHRNEILNEVRSELSEGNKVICISTQLIEAGVDISFDCVIRSLAGLDSIAQAAGRCNRHGEKELQQVYVVDHAEENLSRLKEIKKGKEIAANILIDMKKDANKHGGNLLSRQAMQFYFKNFYSGFKDELNYQVKQVRQNMTELLMSTRANNKYVQAYQSKTGKGLPLFITGSYRTAAEHFHVIDNVTTSVLVPFGKGKSIITELTGSDRIEDLTRLLKTAQHYSVNLYKYELDELSLNDGLISFFDGQIFALKEGFYSREFGLDLKNDSNLDLVMY